MTTITARITGGASPALRARPVHVAWRWLTEPLPTALEAERRASIARMLLMRPTL